MPYLTEVTARQITAIHACVNIIAGTIATLPTSIYERTATGEHLQIEGDPRHHILNMEFAPRWSAATAWEYMTSARLLHGDAFAIIRRNGSRVVAIEPVHPIRVSVFVTQARRLVYQIYPDPLVPIQGNQPDATVEIFDQDDILHVTGPGFNGARSMPPLRNELRTSGVLAKATQDYAAHFFANNARADFVLKSPGTINPEQMKQLRTQLESQHQGVANAHKAMILSGGMEFQSITLPLEDVQLLEIRKFQVEEIARAFGVPPFMIGHNEKTTSWGSGVEAMGVGFVRYTLRSHLNAFQNEFNRKLFRSGPPRFMQIDTTDLERADTKTMFDGFRVAIGGPGMPGFMSIDEVRAKIKLGKVPGGDQLYSGGNRAADGPAEPVAPPAVEDPANA
jgi:HK97 family phage portal protein